jgi:hypothetical protein
MGVAALRGDDAVMITVVIVDEFRPIAAAKTGDEALAQESVAARP